MPSSDPVAIFEMPATPLAEPEPQLESEAALEPQPLQVLKSPRSKMALVTPSTIMPVTEETLPIPPKSDKRLSVSALSAASSSGSAPSPVALSPRRPLVKQDTVDTRQWPPYFADDATLAPSTRTKSSKSSTPIASSPPRPPTSHKSDMPLRPRANSKASGPPGRASTSTFSQEPLLPPKVSRASADDQQSVHRETHVQRVKDGAFYALVLVPLSCWYTRGGRTLQPLDEDDELPPPRRSAQLVRGSFDDGIPGPRRSKNSISRSVDIPGPRRRSQSVACGDEASSAPRGSPQALRGIQRPVTRRGEGGKSVDFGHPPVVRS